MTASTTDDLASAERRIQELTKELLEAREQQAATAGANTRLFEEVQTRNTELRAALEQQTATSDILRVIGSSPTDLQPVFDTIVQNAKRLLDGHTAAVTTLAGEEIHLGAFTTTGAPGDDTLLKEWLRPRTLASAPLLANMVRDLVPRVVSDTETDQRIAPSTRETARARGHRSILGVPMVRRGQAIGVITVTRRDAGTFADHEIALIKTFADQAVIAIENMRLFEAEQASKRELQESLEYQTATSEVLNVISRSPTELQPVLNSIAATAARLCESIDALVWRVEAGRVRLAAQYGSLRQIPPDFPGLSLTRGSVTGRAIIDQKTIHVHDLAALTESEYPDVKGIQQRLGHRTTLAVPLLSQGEALGAIAVRRYQVQPFSERQIALLQTFADQAVIAIENTRLFEAEQERSRELQESLAYQTATSEVLNVISRSPTELKPVLDTIAATAARLCDSADAQVYRVQSGWLAMVAQHGTLHLRGPGFRRGLRLTRGTVTGRAVIDQKTVHVDDLSALVDTEYADAKGLQAMLGHRTTLATPLISRGESVGAILVRKMQVDPFSDKQIALLQTFADQAVIAIENARLFEAEQASKRELQESLEYQTATSDVLKVISRSAFDLQSVLNTLTESAARLCRANRANIARVHGDSFEFVAFSGFGSEYSEYMKGLHTSKVDRGSITGRTVMEGRTVHVPDVLADPEFTWFEAQKRGGFRTALRAPLMREGTPIGVFFLTRSTVAPFTQQEIELVSTFADQAVIAIENVRLFEEVQARTRELAKTVEDLEIASQHKNQFVANMSHELRTPLAAILGYAELIQEGFYGAQPEKSLDALTRIRSNGKHLLGLINTVLDIAKIESGQFTLNMTEYAIESVVETVRAATESLAQNKKLTLTTSVDKSLPVGLGDEQRLTQVLLNLVGNAIKFTDTGEVSIAAGARNGNFSVLVTDTGPGIPLDQQDRIFDQFHQVDSSLTKAKGGTGLGLAIAKQIVEMHGGRIWVESTPGKGSTFQMELPMRAEFRKPAL